VSEPEIVTFGCRLNAYESEIIRANAQAMGLGDTIVFNTCAVTAEAERQARQAIRRARREKPEATIVVTGCAAQLDPARFAAMPEVDRVIGNVEKLTREGLDSNGPRLVVDDIMAVREMAGHLVAGFGERARAFVEVQQGCDHRCTFCIIPFARGPNRSVALGPIVEQVRSLVDRGYREVVLTGVDLTDYGRDLPGAPTLGGLVRRLLALVPGLPRLRLSSVDPVEVDDELIEALAEEPRLMPHLHLSVQAGDDLVLKRMRRRHLRQDVIDICARVRAARPDVVFSADLIAGFPTETEAMFANTLDLVEECSLTYLHVFPYSERPGTPAARMPAVPRPVRSERAARLRAAGDRRLGAFLDNCVGRTVEVLVERDGRGLSEHYAPVVVDGGAPDGRLVAARIYARGERTLHARARARPAQPPAA
jgi:threonylcarbamoyladenosine tRNA methylthiotransferase MtaB